MGARKYLFKKVLTALGTLFFVLTLNFFLFRAVGNPVDDLARAQKLDAAERAQVTAEFGLDKPLPQQYLVYMKKTLQGDLGLSYRSGQPVSATIAGKIMPTLLLVGFATLFSTIIGVFLGIRSAWKRGTFFDQSSMVGGMFFYSAPDFWLGMILLMVFAAGLGWFPVSGFSNYNSTGFAHVLDIAHHMFLPCLTLTIGYFAEYQLIMRSTLIDVMGEDFVGIARAKGLSEKLVRRKHAVPNALLPITTLTILYLAYVLGGAVGVETVFSYPGLGLLIEGTTTSLDFPVMQGLFLLFSSAVIAGNLVADILYGYLDPRVREA